jgi:hypothetical protein
VKARRRRPDFKLIVSTAVSAHSAAAIAFFNVNRHRIGTSPIARLPALFRAEPPRVCNAVHLERAWERLIVAAAAGEPRRGEHLEAVRLRRA